MGTWTHLWKVGEKRFLSSFTLEPPFFTALAALAALALASSVGSRYEGADGGWEIFISENVSRQDVQSSGEKKK